MISLDDRLNYYLGDTKWEHPPTDHKKGYDAPIFITRENYKINWKTIHPNTAYPIDISRFLRYSDRMWFNCGDVAYTGPNWPIFIKIRDSHDLQSKGIIANLNSQRHIGNIFKYPDIPWNEKKNELIWRGVDTGKNMTVRLDFVKQFKDKYDVGFSQYVQDALKNPMKYPQNLLKGPKTIEELLKYKYLPVVDGNDKSSSLGWVMASNSLPIMPKPRFHSWMCEPWMKAGQHYVEVKRDFSDLPEKLKWCIEHDDECQYIAEEGKKFMIQFMNPVAEEYLERKLANYATIPRNC